MRKISFLVLAVLLGVATVGTHQGISLSESNGQSVAQAASDNAPAHAEGTEPAPRRLSITLAVDSPDQILVKEGEQIINGQIIATNVRERERLVAQASQLKLAIAELSQPLPKPAPPPEPSYATEEAAIASAKASIKFVEAQQSPEFVFRDEGMVATFEADRLRQQQTLAEQQMKAHLSLNYAIANLQEAKSNYQRELYQHQLKLLEIDQENRRRAAAAISQGEKLVAVEKEISQLDFRSPYGGTVRKVKILGQNGRLLNVEILVINGDRRS